MTLTKISTGIYVDKSIYDTLEKADGIIFDCDGVLIDIKKSYNLAIIKTAQYVLKTIGKIDTIKVDYKIIDGFKATGGFNDEVDLTYAAILSLVAANKLEKNPNDFIFNVIKNCDYTGIKSVESYLDSLVDVSYIKEKLNYPGLRKDNLLYEIFDQLFFGPQLYEKSFSKKSKFSEPGLIEHDDIILDNILVEKLKKRFSSVAMLTGRGVESVRYSLGALLDEFNLDSSFFLEDEPRELAKPNPKPLYDSIKKMNSKSVIYVGDSMEDLMMAKKVSDLGLETTFCGIIGTSHDPQEKLKLFEKNDAHLVLYSIRDLPKVLNLE